MPGRRSDRPKKRRFHGNRFTIKKFCEEGTADTDENAAKKITSSRKLSASGTKRKSEMASANAKRNRTASREQTGEAGSTTAVSCSSDVQSAESHEYQSTDRSIVDTSNFPLSEVKSIDYQKEVIVPLFLDASCQTDIVHCRCPSINVQERQELLTNITTANNHISNKLEWWNGSSKDQNKCAADTDILSRGIKLEMVIPNIKQEESPHQVASSSSLPTLPDSEMLPIIIKPEPLEYPDNYNPECILPDL